MGCEPCAGNCQLEGPRNDIGKGELPILAGHHHLGRGVIFTGKAYTGPRDDGSRTINNCSADAPWQLLIEPLLGRGVAHPPIFGTRRRVLLNRLTEADRRATQRGKHKNYESRPKTESHEYISFHCSTSIEIPVRSREPVPALPAPKGGALVTEYKNRGL